VEALHAQKLARTPATQKRYAPIWEQSAEMSLRATA
jgi:hypothetical protein